MNLLYERDKNRITFGGVVFGVTNNVRNEIDLYYPRRLHEKGEVRKSIPSDKPYMPRKFPLGKWEITAIEWIETYKFEKKEFGTVKIRTNASQKVKIWALDGQGGYDHETNEEVIDSGYLGHYSDWVNTLGCWRHDTQKGAEKLARMIEIEMQKCKVYVEVI